MRGWHETIENFKKREEDNFAVGTEPYRQARKRRQNRESAARTRARRNKSVGQYEQQIRSLTETNTHLQIEAQLLLLEHARLQESLQFYQCAALASSMKR